MFVRLARRSLRAAWQPGISARCTICAFVDYQSTKGNQASTWVRDLWRGYAVNRPDVTVQVVVGTTATTVWSRSSANASNTLWNDSGAISLSAYAGQTIQIRFKFDSMDSAYNTYTGWLVDDVVVTR